MVNKGWPAMQIKSLWGNKSCLWAALTRLGDGLSGHSVNLQSFSSVIWVHLLCLRRFLGKGFMTIELLLGAQGSHCLHLLFPQVPSLLNKQHTEVSYLGVAFPELLQCIYPSMIQDSQLWAEWELNAELRNNMIAVMSKASRSRTSPYPLP